MLKAINNLGKSVKRTTAGIILGASLLAGSPVYSQQDINVNGVVTGLPNNNFVDSVKVVAVKVSNDARVDSAYTDASGFYNMDFIWTGNREREVLESKLFPNPCIDERNIIMDAVSSDDYRLRILNSNGQLILSKDVRLERGGNQITLNGGQAGVYFITLTNGVERQMFKSVQTAGSNLPINVPLISSGVNLSRLKSGLEDILMVGDEVRLEFSYPNTNPKNSYNSKDTTFTIASNQTIDQQLQQMAYLFSTTFKPFLDDGAPVTTISPGWTTTLDFPAPVGTKVYVPNGNNEINIQESFFPLNGELGNVVMHHDTSNYTVAGVENGVLSWIVLRTQNQPTEVRNKVQTSSSDLIPEATTIAPLDSLDGRTLNYYTLPKKAETQPGTWYRMDYGMVRGLMASSGDGLETSKFIQVPPYGHVVLMSTVYDNDLTKFPTQANMDRAIGEYNKAINLTMMANNDGISQPTQFFYTNRNDSIWSACQLRAPIFDNVELLTFAQSSPGVGRVWTNTYTYDGEARLYFSQAEYPELATNGQIFTENYSATYGITEGSGSLGPYVYNGVTGLPTDLAGRMGRWVKILDLGSGNSKK